MNILYPETLPILKNSFPEKMAVFLSDKEELKQKL
jgi:hypothetical protein